MTVVATRRLVDAASTLSADERALLNLWVHRGLDDEALAGMTGMSGERIAERRDRIVTHLSEELGLPPPDVNEALAELAGGAAGDESSRQPAASTVQEEAPSTKPGPADDATRTETVPAVAATEPPPRSGSSKVFRLLLAVTAVFALALLVVVLTTSHGSGQTPPSSGRSTPATPKPPVSRGSSSVSASTSATVPTPLPQPRGIPLSSLPGDLTKARGELMLLGKPPHLRLRLRVRSLPTVRTGHYEAWLYDSILDSLPLTTLRPGSHTVVVGLPAMASQFRWIDVSFQPPGFINHSGESVLRAANPAHQRRARLAHRAARRRVLRKTTDLERAQARKRSARHRAAARAHRRRAANGSKKDRTSK
jgi:hypothetical protein